MEPVKIMLVGCGMMGARHVRGYGELERAQPGSLRLAAVCDPREDAAALVAAEAEQLLGYRPATYPTAEDALANETAIEAADVVTDNRTHDAIAIPLLDAGLDLIVEKPLGLTVARGRAIVDAAARADRVLAVAENNRRDPMNRLVRHVIESGFIGTPHVILQTSVTPGRRILASPWRHSLAYGGLALDIGIHQGYALEMLLGPIDTVHATSKQVWATRRWDAAAEDLPVESDDVFAATLTFENGVQGTWTMCFAGLGGGQWQRMVIGEQGTVEGPPDRSGRPVRARRNGEVLEEGALVDALPDFELNEIESHLFGTRPGGYSLESRVTDRKLIAAERADFVDSVRTRRPPEVPGELGLRSVAIIYALLESAASGQTVRVADVLSGAVHEFQDRVDAAEPTQHMYRGQRP